MKNNRNLIIGMTLLIIGIVGINGLSSRSGISMGGMVVGGKMMDGRGMKLMMEDMMGARLPPGIDPGKLPDSTSNGARLLGHFCTQCHALPDPKQHSAVEWPGVVKRMTRNMNAMGKTVPSRKRLETIVVYLQKHAK